jgi:gamma-glutamyltranspeptidase / glutathione hydrolase
MSLRVPATPVRALRAVAATADQAATQAAMEVFVRGGNAVDAAIGANAAIAVTGPHLCGLGGDLLALVRTPDGEIQGLNASGRAGSGADADALRADGHRAMPMRHDIRAATVPGCVDGWAALHERYGSLDLARILAPAVRLAASGFPASPLLVGSLAMLDEAAAERFAELVEQATRPGARVRRPGVALTLRAIGAGGREAFYGGAFGEGLLGLGAGWFSEADLVTRHADWVTPLGASAFGVDLHTIGPNSQGYLLLGAARLADAVGVPADPADAAWAHLLVEAAATAGFDRPDVLHQEADGTALVEAIEARAHLLDVERAGRRPVLSAPGDTTYLCTADATGLAVSLIQSNASGFGTWLVEPTTGINVHNRGLGFSLQPGHPAELAPGRRPPHTLCPAMATRDGALAAVFGTMGGDAQPQILLQVAARLFAGDSGVADAIAAGRWVLQGAGTGFDTWTSGGPPAVVLEGQAPDAWRIGLAERGHVVADAPAFDSGFGHAHAIVVEPTGGFAASADPRARVGSAAGL